MVVLLSTTKVVYSCVFILVWFYLVVFVGNLFSKKSHIGMQITSLEGGGHKKALAGGLGENLQCKNVTYFFFNFNFKNIYKICYCINGFSFFICVRYDFFLYIKMW